MNRFLGTAVLVVQIFGAVTTLAAERLSIAHCLKGCPTGTAASNEIVIRHLYAVSINENTRLADWVSYRILPGSIGVASLLPREWHDDQLARNGATAEMLDGEENRLVQPTLGDQPESVYRITEFAVAAADRGRLVPMTGFAGTGYWPDLNLLSIMTPMKSDLRLGSWSRLDQSVNSTVRREGELFVITGPVYAYSAEQQGSRRPVDVETAPVAFFKVIANQAGELAAFVFDQDLPVHASHCEQLSDLDSVERTTGLDLFPEAESWPTGSLVGRLGC